MLTDVALKNLKPREKAYKVTDRDGLYVQVSTSGTLTFRLDYRLHGRHETLTLGNTVPPVCPLLEPVKRRSTLEAVMDLGAWLIHPMLDEHLPQAVSV